MPAEKKATKDGGGGGGCETETEMIWLLFLN